MRNPTLLFRRGFTLIEMLVVVTIVFVVIGLIAPAIVDARSASRKSQCKANLHLIGLAMHNYHETFGTFPPGWVSRHSMPTASYGRGWGLMLLPFVEQGGLFKRIGYRKPLPPANELLQTNVEVYRCPMDPTPDVNPLRSNYGTSNYSGNAGTGSGYAEKGPSLTHWLSPRRTQFWPGETPVRRRANGIFWLSSSTRFRDITDGSSNTLFVGERSAKSGAGIWAGVGRNDFFYDVVTDCGPGNEINKRFTSFSSYHKGGAHFGICDGATRFISETISPKVFQNLSTRAGGEF